MHAIIAAIFAALLSVLLLKLLHTRRLLGSKLDSAGIALWTALLLALAGLALIVLAWAGVASVAWAPWVVWAGLAVYLASAIIRAAHRMA
jgi:hypothetical protein